MADKNYSGTAPERTYLPLSPESVAGEIHWLFACGARTPEEARQMERQFNGDLKDFQGDMKTLDDLSR